MILSQIISAFGAGLLTSVSPCVYPMIPISVRYLGSQAEAGHRSRVVLFFLGQVVAFTVLGIVAVSLGEIFGFSSESPLVNGMIGVFLIVFGVAPYFSYMPRFLSDWNNRQANSRLMQLNILKSWFAPFLVGAGSALVASPCTSPILGSVLVMIAGAETFYIGVVYMLFYSLGTSLLFLALGLGILQAKRLPKAGNWLSTVHKVSSVLIFGVGIYFIARVW